MHRKLQTLGYCVMLATCAGCEAQVGRPPVASGEFDAMKAGDAAKTYPDNTVLQYNVQRALDSQLPGDQRVASLKLVMRLGGADPQTLDQLAAVLGNPDTPDVVRNEVLNVLLQKDYPGMGRHVVRALPNLKSRSPLREQVLEWLLRHPDKADLSDIVRLWALEPPNGPDETRFRILVERMTNRRWQDALLDGVNARGEFYARGSAMEILAGRLDKPTLAKRILAITPETTAMAALKTFVGAFDYVPSDGRGLLTVATLFRSAPAKIAAAARLCQKWRTDYAYTFALRDFHLLSRLAEDTAQPPLIRAQLILRIGQALEARQHVRHRPIARGAGDDYVDLFAVQVGNMTMADLWDIYLLSEMLGSPRIQQALRVVAVRDRTDTTTAWGGLIFYENGQASAKLYPPKDGSNDDAKYVPGDRLERDENDSLCRFLAHFDKVYNNEHIGPDAAELQDARDNGYCGLILTSVSEFAFSAHYYTPQGNVVSLGKFPFRE